MSAYRRCTNLGVLFAAAAVACDDSTTAPAEPLNLDETEALYLGMQELASDTAPNLVSVTTNGGIVACPLGGQVTVA